MTLTKYSWHVSWYNYYHCYTHCTDVETEAWKDEVILPKATQFGLAPGQSDPRSYTAIHSGGKRLMGIRRG